MYTMPHTASPLIFSFFLLLLFFLLFFFFCIFLEIVFINIFLFLYLEMSTALPVVITPPVYFRQRGSLTRGCATGCRINCFNSAGSGSRNSTGVVHMEFSHASAENYSPLAVFHDIRDNHFFVACKVKAPATAKIHAFHKSQEARATYGGNLSSFSWANFKVELVCIQAFLFSGFSL